nr:complement C4-A-like [Odocoileus virginianus texanus]
MRLLWGLIWASGFFALSLQKPRLLLFSPSVVRIGVPLSVAVKLQDAPSGQVVRGSVFLRNPSHVNELCSPKVDFSLSSDRDFKLLNLPIPQERARICRLHLLRGAPEVQLMVQSSWLRDSLSKQTDMQGVNLLFSSRRGHLFLQTDQPVYNPGQRVRYRVFALDQKMRPATDILTVTVENSQGFRVQKREVVAPSSIFQDNFLIPDISEPGTWKISARFSDSLDSNSSTQFEVKKYVLPNFEVKIIPENPYILTTPGFLSDIQVIIQARYIYGKPVQGVAYVRFGLLGEDGEKTFLRGLESQTKLVDGQCQISLQKAEFQGVLEKLHISINDLPGLRLYVAAAVIESPGGELEEAELMSWRFVSSPFSLDLSKTKQQLIPGVPFLLQARVRDMSGSPASGIPVKVSAKLFSGSTSKNEDFERNTDGSGQVIVSIGVPPTISEVQLSVSAGSPHPAVGGLTVKAPLSRSSGFLSIEWQNPRPLKVGETLNLNLQAVGISGSFSHFYYMVPMGAVDTALYAVGGKSHKPLDMVKVFEAMNSYDLGCGPGGGDSAPQVFKAAGLAFSDGDHQTEIRKSLSCPKESKPRKKRNVNFQKAINEKLGQYTSPVAKRCCLDGLTRLPMVRTCEQRADRVQPLACREPFLSCCQFAESLRKKARTRGQVGLARAMELLQEEDLIEEDDIPVRSFFPENWLWKVEEVDRSSQLRLLLPDSLTTWEIHGVSLSKRTGLCVATPARLRVFREFHMHLRLPHSVRRFEQLELRPVLYNYLDRDLTVSVHVSPVEGLCLAGGGGLAQQVQVPAGSARPVGFSVVPIAAAAVSLKVVARGSLDFPVGDAISKILHVEREGAIHREEMVYELNPLDPPPFTCGSPFTPDKLYWGSVTTSPSNVLSPTLAPRSPADPIPQVPAMSIETTAYGLLHLLLWEGKAELADQAASWLSRQGSFQGGYRSTQDTVMALDALSAYWIASHTTEEKGLNVTLSSLGRSGLKSHVLQLTNHQVHKLEEELQFSLGSKINVEVGGNSKGTLKVLHSYNVMDMTNTTCQDLQVEVTVVGHVEYTMEAEEDYQEYEYEDSPAGDDPKAHSRPVTPLQLFDGRRNRRRREAPKAAEEQESRVQYSVCIWRTGKVGLSGMAIADITLLSGFHALRADLEKLTSLSDRYVSHFETEGPHVLLYFDSVPTSRECVGFGAVQEVPVGLVQPASAVLYDYYNPEHKCSVFYGAPRKSKLLSTLCSADVCQCAEGKCPRQRRALERGQQDVEGYRMKFACYSPRVDYAFQVKVLREDSRAAFRLFETHITQVLHFTKDAKATADQTRNFLVRASCRLQLEPGKEYLIMGLDGATYDLKGDPQYLLDSNSWIEEMPSKRMCQSTRHRTPCAQLNSFLEEYGTQGCQV